MSVNGHEFIEKLTGIPKDEQLKIMEDVRNNQKLLDNCCLHDFSIQIPQNSIVSKWKCTNCGGIVGDTEKRWYEKGIQHSTRKDGYLL